MKKYQPLTSMITKNNHKKLKKAAADKAVPLYKILNEAIEQFKPKK